MATSFSVGDLVSTVLLETETGKRSLQGYLLILERMGRWRCLNVTRESSLRPG